MKNHLYLRSIWSHIVAFSDMFNDMSVLVYDKDGKAKGWKPVPITVGPKDKVIAALIADNGQSVFSPDNYLPRISVTWNGLTRNTDRQKGALEKRRLFVDYEDGSPSARIDSQPVPYDITFEVTVWTKHMDDLAQILENILPFFNPDAPVSLYERGTNQERISKVTLDSVNTNFVTDLSENDRRVLQADLQFTMEMVFYKPEEPPAKPIKRVTVRLGADTERSFVDPVVDGDTVNAVLLPCVSGADNYLDLDSKMWNVIQEFDQPIKDYMVDEHHNNMRTTTPFEGIIPTPDNPNENDTKDPYYGLYGTQLLIGLDGYYYDIEGEEYSNQIFVLDGLDEPSLSWTVETSSWAVNNDNESGILYEGGDIVVNYDISGSYYVENTFTECFDREPHDPC